MHHSETETAMTRTTTILCLLIAFFDIGLARAVLAIYF
jgi:hypothetical protein